MKVLFGLRLSSFFLPSLLVLLKLSLYLDDDFVGLIHILSEPISDLSGELVLVSVFHPHVTGNTVQVLIDHKGRADVSRHFFLFVGLRGNAKKKKTKPETEKKKRNEKHLSVNKNLIKNEK